MSSMDAFQQAIVYTKRHLKVNFIGHKTVKKPLNFQEEQQ